MIKTRSYIGWFLISTLLWMVAWLYYGHFNAPRSPEVMAHMIEQDLQHRQQRLETFTHDTRLLDKIWRRQLSSGELAYVTAQPFTVYAYDKSGLVFWNTNKTVAGNIQLPAQARLVSAHQSYYVGQRIYNAADPARYLQVLIPVYHAYSIENEYLHSGFVASMSIPPGSVITDTPGTGFIPIHALSGATLFYLQISKDMIQPQPPDNLLVIIVCCALAAMLICVHLIAIQLSRKHAVGWGIIFLVTFVVVVRGLNYKLGMPFHLELRMVFSPQIFASSAWLPSFGDLLLNVLAMYWIFIFITTQSRRHIAPGKHVGNKFIRAFCFCLIQVILFSFGLYLMYLIQVLVLDSDISFDTTTFDATNRYTLLVLVAIAIIARVGIYATEAANIYADKLIEHKWYKYAATIVMASIVAFVLRHYLVADQRWPGSALEDTFYMLVFMLMVLYTYLKDRITFLKNKFRMSLFSLLFWSVYASLLCTIMFAYNVYQQERYITRVAFAEKLSRQQDADLELMFGDIVTQVTQDSVVRHWLTAGDNIDSKQIYRHFGIQYISPYLSRYRTDIYLYGPDGRPVSSEQGLPIDTLEKGIARAIPTMNDALYFSNRADDSRYYVARIPVPDTASGALLGYVCMEINIRKDIPESLYPELLDMHKRVSGKKTPEYSYAIYKNGLLTYQSGTYTFRTSLEHIPHGPQRWYVDGRGYSECYYRAGPGIIYVIAHKGDLLRDTLSIFSFLFGIYFFFCLVESLVKRVLVYFLFGRRTHLLPDLSLSFKVKYFVIGFTFVSFFVIGFATIISLTNKYSRNNIEQGQKTMGNVSEVLSQYFVLHNSKVSVENFRRELSDPEFVYFLSNIALQQKMDVNIYDTEGKLVITTQEHMYNKHLLARLIAPEAFFAMGRRRPGIFIQEEHIGALSFVSLYAPIRNHSGNTIGYLNIPSFYSGLSLQSQIASLLTTLVNIYTVLLLLSGIVTYLFIHNLTTSLRLVADKLEKVNLQKNELIDWPYHDEIGMLVAEYNKMVLAVEKHAVALVQDERQNAWREMAKQVAHEIKNPLTPMKLNIQYLQQAINNNHPDIIQLVKKVSASIIEQIDNLNYIASEFSNFAKLPEKNTEAIDMVALLGRIVSLYSNEERLTMHYAYPDSAPDVYADKSQMLRIFTNIIKNAVDAIPEERQGVIDVRLTLEANGVLIAVADNGSGFTQEIRERIFEPYFTTKSSGTGLGLAMTKKIIELWEGTIWFESESGVGTTCFVSLPFGHPAEYF